MKLRRLMERVTYCFMAVFMKPSTYDKTLPRVMFGFGPRRGSAAILKASKLKALFGNAACDNNILYVCSGNIPLWYCNKEKKRGVKIIVNQNGVYYPGWYGRGYKDANEKHLLGHYLLADYIIFQSEFCKEAAERYLAKAHCENQILYNPVNTAHFKSEPHKQFDIKAPVLLSTGNYYSEVKIIRLQLLLDSFKGLLEFVPGARLIIAGNIVPPLLRKVNEIIRLKSMERKVDILPQYRHEDAPSIYRQADIYVNTQFNDSCPSTVLEAMSCGLAVVHLNCGGTPELVGDAGIGVNVEKSFESFAYPSAKSMVEAIIKAIDNYQVLSNRARERCVTLFDEALWKKKHEEIFIKALND